MKYYRELLLLLQSDILYGASINLPSVRLDKHSCSLSDPEHIYFQYQIAPIHCKRLFPVFYKSNCIIKSNIYLEAKSDNKNTMLIPFTNYIPKSLMKHGKLHRLTNEGAAIYTQYFVLSLQFFSQLF